jgi:hypothetical protein
VPSALISLTKVLEPLLGTLSNTGNALLSPLSNTFETLLGTLAEALHTLLGTLPKSFDTLLRPLTDTGNPFTGTLAHVLHCTAGALSDVLHHVAGIAEQVAGPAANVAKCLSDALKQLGIAVERGQHAREDLRDIVEPGLQQSLGFDLLYVELDLAEPRSSSGVKLDEMPSLRENRQMDPQVIKLELDLVDLDDGGVDVDVDRVVDLLRIDDRVVGQVLTAPAVVRAPGLVRVPL